MIKLMLLYLNVVFGVILLNSCKFKAPSLLQPSNKEIRIQISSEAMSLDPALAEDGIALRVLPNLHRTLFRLNENNLLIADAASTYSCTADGLRCEVEVKDNLHWSDGTKLKAEHFVFGIRRSLTPRLLLKPNKLAHFYNDIKNIRWEQNKIIFELSKPLSHLTHLLSLTSSMPMREDFFGNSKEWNLNLPTSGDYMVLEYKKNEWYLLKSNLQESAPKIRLVIVQDESTAAQLFRNSKLDILTKVSEYDFEDFNRSGFIRNYPMDATYYFGFNTQKIKMDDRVAIRNALRNEFTALKKVIKSGEEMAWSWVYSQPFETPSVEQLKGKSNSLKFLSVKKLNFYTDASSRNRLLAEWFQNILKVNFKVPVEIQTFDWKSYVKQLGIGDNEVFRFAWLNPYFDSLPKLQVFTSGSPNNYTHWKNKEYDGWVQKYSFAKDSREKQIALIAALNILEQEVPIIPIYHYAQTYVVSHKIVNFKPNRLSYFSYAQLQLE